MLREENFAHIRQVITSLVTLADSSHVYGAAEELEYLGQLVKEDWQSGDKS